VSLTNGLKRRCWSLINRNVIFLREERKFIRDVFKKVRNLRFQIFRR
jgi:hypothetical protein